ncbi:DUF402 domain-containing protein [Williamsia sterculiae]|nr:DUF402 domain-containing protein [Williamsia sterculiae]
MTNTDNKGFVRPVEEYRQTEFGLYMARSADHRHFDRLQSWLLPAFDLRISVFGFLGDHRADERLYLDVAAVTGPDDRGRWRTVDWYLDLIDRPGRALELVDVDELLAAHRSGLLDAEACERAVRVAAKTMIGAAIHGDDVEAWLRSAGVDLTWPEDDR